MTIKPLAYNTRSLHGNKPMFVEMNSLMLKFCWHPTGWKTALHNSKGTSWIVEEVKKKRKWTNPKQAYFMYLTSNKLPYKPWLWSGEKLIQLLGWQKVPSEWCEKLLAEQCRAV